MLVFRRRRERTNENWPNKFRKTKSANFPFPRTERSGRAKLDETYSRVEVLERCIFMQIENRYFTIYLDNPLPSDRKDEDRLYDLIQRVRLSTDEMSGASSCRSKTAKTTA
jgi:hypothetical protein